jgi:hypothetical protein
MSEFITLPKRPDAVMLQAIEDYFSTRLKYRDRKNDDAMHADCWMASMAYIAMVEAYEKANEPKMLLAQGTLVIDA